MFAITSLTNFKALIIIYTSYLTYAWGTTDARKLGRKRMALKLVNDVIANI